MKPRRRLPPLTARDFEVLRSLWHCIRMLRTLRPVAQAKCFVKPRYLGGRDESYHSATLRKLVRRGLARKVESGGITKTSWAYGITKKGEAKVDTKYARQRVLTPWHIEIGAMKDKAEMLCGMKLVASRLRRAAAEDLARIDAKKDSVCFDCMKLAKGAA